MGPEDGGHYGQVVVSSGLTLLTIMHTIHVSMERYKVRVKNTFQNGLLIEYYFLYCFNFADVATRYIFVFISYVSEFL